MKWKKQDCPFCNGNGKAWLSHDCPSGYKYKTCDHEELDEVMYSKLEKVEKEIQDLKEKKEEINNVIKLSITYKDNLNLAMPSDYEKAGINGNKDDE